MNFCFIIPVYNFSDYIVRCLDSIKSQTYKNWRAIVVDDCSSDGSFELIKSNIDNRFTYIKNDVRMRQAYSRYIAYTQASDDEICVMLDGDDWLFDTDVLTKLDSLYISKPGLNVTYGGHLTFQDNCVRGVMRATDNFPESVITNNSYREYNWISQHMRTVRGKIIKGIPEHHLKYQGEWLRGATDQAEMFYALEQSDGRHCNNGFPCYVYNIDSSKQFDSSWFNKHSAEWNRYYDDVKQHLRGLR